jgi:glycosyltransferase involved in cell wall biosynthesis
VIPEKGCLDIIRAAGQLPNILFKLIGKTSKEIVSQQKTDNVLLTEEQPKTIVSEELDKADVFLFPSFFPGEGFSVALLEAMAHGVPCVVSNWAANADMIQNQGGIIIPVHDVSALVEAIKSMEDKKKRDEMSKWNINKVRDCYCDKQVMDMYINTYKKVLRS